MVNHRGGSGNFAEDREKASEVGKRSEQHGGDNFKNDPQHAPGAGREGGKSNHDKNDNQPDQPTMNAFLSVARRKAITAGYSVVDTDDKCKLA